MVLARSAKEYVRFWERKCGKCMTVAVSCLTELLNSVKNITSSINYKIISLFSSDKECMYCLYRR